MSREVKQARTELTNDSESKRKVKVKVKIERPRGTRDFLPQEMEKRRAVERIMREIAESYGYREVLTPTFEHLELFTIKSGEGIVEEIYAFKDKGGRDLALRPELTAPVMRMFVNECSVMPRPLRFYYFANCFRYERPQRGRYREFWQFGVELIGSDRPKADAEVITLAYRILEKLGLDFKLHIGHVGILRKLLSGVEEDTASRIFRFIDKGQMDELRNLMVSEGMEELYEKIAELTSIKGGLDVLEKVEEFEEGVKSDLDYLREVCELLDCSGVSYTVDMSIVRGLDYYTGIVFEAYAEGLGAQKQVCGGGSYRLAHLFGGEDVPSTGFAIGFDRVMEVCRISQKRKLKVSVVDANCPKEAIRLAEKLRMETNCVVVTDVMGRNLKKQLGYSNADFVVIVGKKEIEGGYYSLKDMKTGEQKRLSFEELVRFLNERQEE